MNYLPKYHFKEQIIVKTYFRNKKLMSIEILRNSSLARKERQQIIT